MEPFQIFKITPDLEPHEVAFGVIRVEPVMGNGLTAADYFDLAISTYRQSGRFLTPGEIGCALSHLKACERIAASGRPGVILEDDIPICEDTHRNLLGLAADGRIDERIHFIHLGVDPSVTFRMRPSDIASDTRIHVLSHHQRIYGAFAYLLSPHGARTVMERQADGFCVSDNWHYFFEGTGIGMFHAGIFRHESTESTLDGQRSRRPANLWMTVMKDRLLNLGIDLRNALWR